METQYLLKECHIYNNRIYLWIAIKYDAYHKQMEVISSQFRCAQWRAVIFTIGTTNATMIMSII